MLIILRKLFSHGLTIAAACLLAGGVGIFWALGSIDQIFAYRSPLKNSPPLLHAQVSGQVARQVVIVLVDALRYDTASEETVMPVLAQLRNTGASARMHSRAPSYSQPGYTTLLTGAWPDLNDGPPVNKAYADLWTFTQDDLFSMAHRAGLKTAVSGYYWFERMIPQQAVSASFYTAGEDRAADRAVVDAALPWLRSGAYALVLIHIDQVDFAGHHEGGPHDPRWNQAAARADQLLGEILASLELSRDIVLVVSDHGQIDRGGHGGHDAVTLVEPFVIAGKSIKPGQYPDIQMVDVAPTIAALVGAGQPASSQGRPLTEWFDLSPEWGFQARAYAENQHQKLLETLQIALDAPEAGSMEEIQARQRQTGMAWRITVLLAGLLVPALILVWLRGAGWRWWLGGGVLSQAVFHLYYGVIDNRTYSLSSVDSQAQLLTSATIGALLGLLAGGLLVVLAARRIKRQPARALIVFVCLSVYLQSFPVLWSYFVNGWRIQGVLPEAGSAFVGVLAALQMAVTGVSGLAIASAAALAHQLMLLRRSAAH